ncbi:hypothetical protein BGX23_001346, partial [Mortierella sp. AD031]
MSQPPEQPPNQAVSDPTLPQPASPNPIRHGILRNPSGLNRTGSSPPAPRRMESIILPPADFDDDLEDDEEEDQFDEKELTADEIYQNALGGRWGEGPSKVDVVDAERDFRQLERSLTQISRRSSMGPPELSVIRRKSSRKQQQQEAGLTQDEQIKQEGDFDFEAHLKDKIIPGVQAKGLKHKTMG